MKFKVIVGLLLLASPLSQAAEPSGEAENKPLKVESLFQQNCASCHGATLSGGMAGSLLDDKWLQDGEEKTLKNIIQNGDGKAGMPAWKAALDEDQIRALVIYIKEEKHKADSGAATEKLKPKGGVYHSAGATFRVETLFAADEVLWGLEFLDDRSFIATQRDGKLWHFKAPSKATEIKSSDKGLLQPEAITGLPKVWREGQGGLLDVAVHPKYKKNGWIYLAYTDTVDGKSAMTRIVRGKIKRGKWTKQQTIFSVDSSFYTPMKWHFGSRILLHDGYVYFSVGDRANQNLAQDLSKPNGKIYRLHDDGRIPKDNPFVDQPGALPAIWSYGHRNPQGLALQPGSGLIWASEHGPRGGDEINVIEKGRNYGWPVITYGMNYDGTPITSLTEKAGMEQPKHYWVPSIAVAGINFYEGSMFPEWSGKLLASGMAAKALHLLRVDGTHVLKDEVLLADQGRIRDAVVAADGSIYILATSDNFKGSILRLSAAPSPVAK
ncbi:MAG: secretion protein HlyD [Alteromonadaceae bacterium]|nr:MAG: secretion protein HlyD [Alteromonadaceae bacterium]